MTYLTPPPPLSPVPAGRDDQCLHCGAALDPRYYFCRSCATPYQDVENVLTPMRLPRPTSGELVRKHAPAVSVIWWSYFTLIVGGSLLLQLISGGASTAVHMMILDALLFVMTAVFAIHYWPTLSSQLKRIGFDRSAAYVALGLLAPMLLLNYGYHGWLESLQDETASPIDGLRSEGFSRASLIFLLCVLPAILEEIAFRGLIQHWLQTALHPRKAIILSAALFSAMHLSIVSAPYLFLAGCLMGWSKWKTGSLYPAMLIHLLHNLAVVELF